MLAIQNVVMNKFEGIFNFIYLWYVLLSFKMA